MLVPAQPKEYYVLGLIGALERVLLRILESSCRACRKGSPARYGCIFCILEARRCSRLWIVAGRNDSNTDVGFERSQLDLQ